MAPLLRPIPARTPAESTDDTLNELDSALAEWHRYAKEHEEITTRLAALQGPTTSDNQSPLLRLPTELRLAIYDELFEPMVQQQPEHFKTYVLPSEWPTLGLGTYASLLSTCKQLESEAKGHFETRYLPRMTLYFDSILSLRLLAEKAELDPVYRNVQICLHDSVHSAWTLNRDTTFGYWDVLKGIDGIAGDLFWLVCHQADSIRAMLRAFDGEVRLFLGRGIGAQFSRLGAKLSNGIRLDRRVCVLHASIPDSSLQISVHGLREYPGTIYTVVRGSVRDLCWRPRYGGWSNGDWRQLEDLRTTRQFRATIQEESFAQRARAKFESIGRRRW